MESLFLTGKNGFLGKHVNNHLKNKYRVFSPTRYELELSDSQAVKKYFHETGQFDYLLNCAATGSTRNTIKSKKDCFFENLVGFRNIFQNVRNLKRFIQFGSGAEYAKPFSKEEMREEDAGENLPQDAYGLSKFFAGQLLELQQRGKFVNLRIFGIFGPYEDYRIRFISNAIVRSLLDLPIIVNQNSLFDYVYVNDFLKIIDYFIQNPASEISYNITTGNPISLVELGEIVHKLTNNRHRLIIKNSDIKENYTGNNSRLRKFLPDGFEFTSIELAIKELIDWYYQDIKTKNKEELICSL